MNTTPSAAPVVRIARAEDAPSIAALASEGHEAYRSLLPHFFKELDTRYWHTRFIHSLSLQNYFVFVAEQLSPTATDIVGYIELFIKHTSSPTIQPPKRLIIDNLIVATPHQRTGIGTQLLRFAERIAQQREIPIIELQVAAANQAAIELYEKSGFRQRIYTMEKIVAL